MIDRVEFLDLPFRIILDRDFERLEHRHAPQRALVERLAHREFEHADVDQAIGLGDADALDEIADRFRRHAAPAQTGDRRHARIVPARHMAAAHQLGEHALGQHRVGEIEPREFVLMRPRRHRQIVEAPVVERPVILEFERADRMGDALDGVRLAVREIVARIDFPRGAGARMRRIENAVEHRIAQIDIAATPCRSWRAARARRWRIRRRACGGTGRGSPPPGGRGTGCSCPARSACRDYGGSRPGSGRPHRPCRRGSGPRPSRRAARNNRRRDRGACPNRSRASARRARWRRYIPALPWSDWCRRSANGSGRRIPRRCRNSGRSTWRGRYADSRSARAESG